MNISIIFIVAIGFYSFINWAGDTVQGNTNNMSFNINVQSTNPKQQLSASIPLEDGFFKKIQNIAWHDAMATQWKK